MILSDGFRELCLRKRRMHESHFARGRQLRHSQLISRDDIKYYRAKLNPYGILGLL